MGSERRQWQRARAEWPITVVLDDGVHQAKIRDVSRGGVCFFLDRPVPEMTLLRMEFDLPVEKGVRRISGQGAVVRCAIREHSATDRQCVRNEGRRRRWKPLSGV